MSIPQSQSHLGRWNAPASPDAAAMNNAAAGVGAGAGTGAPRFEDSPTVGRAVNSPGSSHQLSPAPYLSFSGPRPPRSAVPSPLSPKSRPFANPAPRIDTYSPTQRPMGPPDTQQTYSNQRDAVEQTTFYSDSSSPPSPEPLSPRDSSPIIPNESRSVSDPISARPPPALQQAPKPAIPGSTTGTTAEMPRNSSIDSAISAVSSKMGPQQGTTDAGPTASDIPALIKKAGSPEAVIQYLLKEKHSQAQQNNQLWRLVDKQRAMILGLNKDLERALKEKEKYRIKLRDVMSDPAISKAAGVQDKSHETRKNSRPSLPSVDVSQSNSQAAGTPESPILDSDSQKHSPIEVAMAPYPITPPADQTAPASSSGVSELLDPVHTMPKSQEHALGRYDHDAEEQAEEQARVGKKDEPAREIPYNANLPPSRSLPSEPPRVPPPKPPTASPPSLSVVEPSPRPDDGLSGFPAPLRKAPPAPLQLKQDSQTAVPEDDESDSDYDEILNVDGALNEKRGRRRTRAEDDRIREIMAFREAEARSASNKDGESQPDAAIAAGEASSSPRKVPAPIMTEAGTASINAVLQGDTRRELAPALMSPGLPASPRPPGMGGPVQSPPLSPRGGFPQAPLSPRPPRQPIPVPPHTPMATPAVSGGDSLSSIPPNVVRRVEESAQPPSPSKSRDSPTERTRIYKGLVTDEYPDLLLPPNALPSVIVQVASSRMKPSRASLISLTQLEEDPVFTLAIISRAEGGELWRVEKDSASLGKLDQRLKQCPSFTARTPDKSLFIGHAPAKLDARRQALDAYMDELVNTPLDMATALELCRYLSTNTLPPNADETGSAAGSATEGSTHMIGPDGRPVRSGYLTKRGKNFGGWKARYFLLDGPLLKYYETPGGAHLGTIKLQNAQIGKQHQNADNASSGQGGNGEDFDNEYRHAFLVLEPKKKDSSSHVKHVLCAESDRERDLWVDALLQWIDYRDPDDEEPAQTAPSAHERHAERHGKSKKSKQTKSQHQPQEDTLVGVRYDSTQAGEAPHVAAPQRSKGAGGSDSPGSHQAVADMNAQANKIISGPKDPQPISDSAAWGNKTGLSVPSYEEKKQRKRSFFGFGPKARSSADGPDSLFDSGATPPQGTYSGPVKQVFGSPLAEAVKYNPPTDVRVPLPSVVYRCIQYLDSKDALLEEGIFRLSGSNVVIKQLRERFNNEGDVNLVTDDQYYDIHAVASLLKLYLRELPTTILTRDLHMEFMATTEMTDRREKLAALNELAQRLPLSNATLLQYLISFLIKIINNADMNKMTVRNVGIVFSPTLNIPAPVFALFLQNYEAIFGIDPEEYELPILGRKEQAQHDASRRFEPPVPRPSTSSGSASPHRQPRIDSMRDYQRSTPTPPLMSNLNGARGSPTQNARHQGYEPPYSQGAVPNTGSTNGGRPAYDNLYGAQNTHDGYNGYPSTRANQHPGPQEDQSGGLAPYDQAYTSSSRSRRESAIFGGNVMGLQPQSSKSRLREEAHY